MADRNLPKGASGPGKGVPIGSSGEGVLPYRESGNIRRDRIQGNREARQRRRSNAGLPLAARNAELAAGKRPAIVRASKKTKVSKKSILDRLTGGGMRHAGENVDK